MKCWCTRNEDGERCARGQVCGDRLGVHIDAATGKWYCDDCFWLRPKLR